MISKSRGDFSSTVTVNDTQEKDINDMQWHKMIINRPISYYRISHADLQRPDMLSMKIYGNLQYFWPLMKFNEIDDIWNDLIPGTMLKCPNALDIEQYFSTTKING